MIRRLAFGVAATGAALTMLLTAATAPASAESDRIGDRGDYDGQLDILSVKATHTKKLVIVVVRARDFRPGMLYGVGINFDTNKFKKAPPEYGAGFALAGASRDIKFGKWTRGKNGHLEDLNCRGDYKTVDYRLDRATYVVPRRCIGKPGKVRVNALTKLGNGRNVDYAPTRYSFMEWLSRA